MKTNQLAESKTQAAQDHVRNTCLHRKFHSPEVVILDFLVETIDRIPALYTRPRCGRTEQVLVVVGVVVTMLHGIDPGAVLGPILCHIAQLVRERFTLVWHAATNFKLFHRNLTHFVNFKGGQPCFLRYALCASRQSRENWSNSSSGFATGFGAGFAAGGGEALDASEAESV